MPTLNSCFTQRTLNFLASSNWQKQPTEVFYKKAVLKHFAILTGKHCVGVYFWQNCLPLGLQLYQKGNPIQVFFCWEIFKKICFKECFWTDFRRWLFGTLFLDSCFQNHPGYYKNTSRFRTRALKHSSAHMLSLYLTPTLSFEPMLVTYVHPWRLIHMHSSLLLLNLQFRSFHSGGADINWLCQFFILTSVIFIDTKAFTKWNIKSSIEIAIKCCYN